MSHANLTPVPFRAFPQEQLEALSDACAILRQARIHCAAFPAPRPWCTLNHAAEYLERQANLLVAPIFALPSEEVSAEGFIESTLRYVTAQLEEKI